MTAVAGMSAMAEGLSPEQALNRAMKSEQTSVRRTKAINATDYKLVYSGKELRLNATPSFYVFNGGDGFIIASGDDRMRPVLAVSDEGAFDASDIPAPMADWLAQYAAEADALLNDNVAVVSENVFDNYAAWQPIEPIVTTKWNQLNPYNRNCPTLNGNKCVTGCVATAMAQVVKAIGYYNGKGSRSYQPSKLGGQTVSFDFEGWTPDFSQMLDDYNDKNVTPTTEQLDQVGNLMLACGVAVGVNYDTSASGAGEPVAGLKQYFGYDDSSVTLYRELFSSAQWESMIYEQLQQGRPLYYAGTGTGGHAFVCDGYQSDGLFHFNWGWGGLSDGYFALTALTPRSQGTGSFEGGYNIGQYISVFVKPGTKPADVSNAYCQAIVACDGNHALPTVGKTIDQFSLMFTIARSVDGRGRDVALSLMIKDPSGNVPDTYLAPLTSEYQWVGVRGVGYNYKARFSKVNLPAGTYHAYPYYSIKGVEGCWPVGQLVTPGQYNPNDHFLLTVGEDGKRTYAIADMTNPSIELYDLTDNGLYANDKSNLLEFVIANYSSTDFAEPISLYLDSEDGKTSTKIGTTYSVIRAGEPLAMSLALTSVKAGSYKVRMARTYYRDVTLGANSFPITVKSGKRPTGGGTVTTDEFDHDGISYRINLDGSGVSVIGTTLTDVAIPEKAGSGDKTFTVTGIAEGAFDGMKQLANVTVPASVKSVGLNAFRGTVGLQSITFEGQAVPYENSVLPFYGINTGATIYVPAEAYDAFKAVHHSPCELKAIGESAITETVVAPFTVSASNGCIAVSGVAPDCVTTVYGVNGVKVATLTGQAVTSPLAQGLYIVRIGDKSVKVAL